MQLFYSIERIRLYILECFFRDIRSNDRELMIDQTLRIYSLYKTDSTVHSSEIVIYLETFFLGQTNIVFFKSLIHNKSDN